MRPVTARAHSALYTTKNVSYYKKVAALDPFGVVVNDVAKFQTWRNRQT
jgi:hypothetical protein